MRGSVAAQRCARYIAVTPAPSPDGGSARIAGFDVMTQARRVREVIVLTGQYAAVDAQRTGRENRR
ncbi:hypothetical protein TOK_2676 [Pseudonocardia sp. N23]|nr:hypothetical protein TOK_2676 [Pseudonocardia sp. N23]